jgi:3-hydroxymyristoyl/3-hydroxydecanoyl-(acyl carrier protein) dehydratase
MTFRDSIDAARISGPHREADDAALFEFRFQEDDPVFAGHFPTHPLVPGVFQLEMTRAAAEWVLDCSLAVREISKAKFQRPILPGETVKLALKWSAAEGTIRARAVFSVRGQRAGETSMKLWRSK